MPNIPSGASIMIQDGMAFSASVGGGYLVLKVPSNPTSYYLTFPQTQGAASTVLTNDGAGSLSWTSPASTAYVGARYYAATGTVSGSLSTITWVTKDFDTANAMSAGIWTVPSTGKYLINANLQIGGTIALNTAFTIQIQKNSVAISESLIYAAALLTSQSVQISDVISLTASDTVRIQVSTSAVLPSLIASNVRNFISISKVGS